jgi:hypothetical protein
MMALPNIRHFRDDLRMTTWLLMGACFQISLIAIFPIRIAVAPAILLLASRFAYTILVWKGFLRNTSLDVVRLGKVSAQLPLSDGSFAAEPSDQQIVVMILGARSSQYEPPHCTMASGSLSGLVDRIF